MGAGASTAVDSEGNSLAVFRQLVPVYERLNMAGSSDEEILQALKQQWVELQAKHSHDMGCFSSKLPPEGGASTAVPNPLAQRKSTTAAAAVEKEAARQAKAAKEAKLAADVAALKAAAPQEVRTVLDGYNVDDDDEEKRVSRVVAEWLVEAHTAAHDDSAKKRLARLVLGVQDFTVNMEWAGVFDDPYKAGLRRTLQALGETLREAFERDGLRAALGELTLPFHELVLADQAKCEKAGVTHVLRSDMDGVVPRPKAWAQDFDGANLALQQRHERVYIHVLVLMAKALNGDFHEIMREVLGPHVVADEGVMARNKDGSWRLTPQKGEARMRGCVRHACWLGCMLLAARRPVHA